MTHSLILPMVMLSLITIPVSCTDEPAVDPAPYMNVQEAPKAEKSKLASLSIRLFPKAGALYVDRKLVGTAARGETLKVDLEPGLHEIVVSRSGCHDHVSKVHLKAGEARHAVVSLVPLRQHLVREPHRRVIRPGMTARGQITLKGPLAKDVLAAMKVKVKPQHDEARIMRIDLENTPKNQFAVRVATFGSKLHAMIVDDKGKVVAENAAKSWSPRLAVKPEVGRKYTLLLAHVAMEKNDAFNLVRYAAYLTPAVARKK